MQFKATVLLLGLWTIGTIAGAVLGSWGKMPCAGCKLVSPKQQPTDNKGKCNRPRPRPPPRCTSLPRERNLFMAMLDGRDGRDEPPESIIVSSCARVEVKVDDFEKDIEDALGNVSLTESWATTVSGKQTFHNITHTATFDASWDVANHNFTVLPNCPFNNSASLFIDMVTRQGIRCKTSSPPHTPLWQTYPSCGNGRAYIRHRDLDIGADDDDDTRNGRKSYIDSDASPGVATCAGEKGSDDGFFRKSDMEPAIDQFCAAFPLPHGLKPGNFHLRQYGPVGILKGNATTTSWEASIYLFATYDQDGCLQGSDDSHIASNATAPANATANVIPWKTTSDSQRNMRPSNPIQDRWPNADSCKEYLRAAMEATGDVTSCKYERALTRTPGGEWLLGYEDTDFGHQEGVTRGGYFWDHCLRWGIVENIQEGVWGRMGI